MYSSTTYLIKRLRILTSKAFKIASLALRACLLSINVSSTAAKIFILVEVTYPKSGQRKADETR